MSFVAIERTESSVSYSIGKNGATAAITQPAIVQRKTENAISLVSVSRAFLKSPEPKMWPTIIETVLPMEIKIMLNIFPIVSVMFVAATTESPLTE